MKFPKKLTPGATIGLVATSSCTTPEKVEKCIAKLEELGYKVKPAANLTTNYGGYMADTGKVRADELNKMFADPEVDAIFCMRGGDGSSRIMEYLDYDMIKANPKIFVGYSDVTNLHLALTEKCGLVTFHGPMVASNMIDPSSRTVNCSSACRHPVKHNTARIKLRLIKIFFLISISHFSVTQRVLK